MLRRLLACLVLLTGLAAAGATAQAEVAGALATRIEVNAPAQPSVYEAASAQSREAASLVEAVTVAVEAEPFGPASSAPAVRLGSDRTRE